MEKEKKLGLASVSPERRREIARMGGLAAHAKGKAHRFTSEQAAEAGRKGGAAVVAKYGREHLSRIARARLTKSPSSSEEE